MKLSFNSEIVSRAHVLYSMRGELLICSPNMHIITSFPCTCCLTWFCHSGDLHLAQALRKRKLRVCTVVLCLLWLAVSLQTNSNCWLVVLFEETTLRCSTVSFAFTPPFWPWSSWWRPPPSSRLWTTSDATKRMSIPTTRWHTGYMWWMGSVALKMSGRVESVFFVWRLRFFWEPLLNWTWVTWSFNVYLLGLVLWSFFYVLVW